MICQIVGRREIPFFFMCDGSLQGDLPRRQHRTGPLVLLLPLHTLGHVLLKVVRTEHSFQLEYPTFEFHVGVLVVPVVCPSSRHQLTASQHRREIPPQSLLTAVQKY